MNGKLLTVTEAASALGIRPATVRAHLLRHRLTYIKVGRAVRISTTEIERILRDGRRPAREPLERGGKHG
jgi:excisionase family DNA binding protein